MSIAQQNDVRVWQERFGLPAPPTPQNIDYSRAVERVGYLIEEGVDEYLAAVQANDLVEIADALGDALWIILGTAVEHGIYLQPIFDAISESNFSKLDADCKPVPHPTIPGKIGKSSLYKPPTDAIRAALIRQGAWQ